MKKKPSAPRKKRVDQAFYDRAIYNQQCAYQERDLISTELQRVQQASKRTYKLLESERAELLARAEKLLAVMKSMELRTENQGSPMGTSIDRWA